MESDNRDKQDRRPYVTPRVEESATFENLVLGCTHKTIGDPPCDFTTYPDTSVNS